MSNRLNSVPDAAAKLGVRSRDKVYELINAGELLSVKVGRRRLISDRAIENYIDLLERDALAERDGQAA